MGGFLSFLDSLVISDSTTISVNPPIRSKCSLLSQRTKTRRRVRSIEIDSHNANRDRLFFYYW